MLSIVASEQAEQDGLARDLDALVREGARRMLLAALKVEVDECVAQHAGERDEAGHALAVRKMVAEPRGRGRRVGDPGTMVHDRRAGHRFSSAIHRQPGGRLRSRSPFAGNVLGHHWPTDTLAGVLLPGQGVTAHQALRMWTINNAQAIGQAHRRGSIERGKLADLVVLSADLLACPPERIKDIAVVATIAGGQLVYQR